MDTNKHDPKSENRDELFERNRLPVPDDNPKIVGPEFEGTELIDDDEVVERPEVIHDSEPVEVPLLEVGTDGTATNETATNGTATNDTAKSDG